MPDEDAELTLDELTDKLTACEDALAAATNTLERLRPGVALGDPASQDRWTKTQKKADDISARADELREKIKQKAQPPPSPAA